MRKWRWRCEQDCKVMPSCLMRILTGQTLIFDRWNIGLCSDKHIHTHTHTHRETYMHSQTHTHRHAYTHTQIKRSNRNIRQARVLIRREGITWQSCSHFYLYFLIFILILFRIFYIILSVSYHFFHYFLSVFIMHPILGLAKNLVSKTDQDTHLKAQGLKLTERTAESLKIPLVGKGSVRTTKIMLDLDKVRWG